MTKTSLRSLQLLVVAALVAVAPACGKRGGPLPPLRPAADRATSVSIVRRGDEVTLRFSLPTHNVDGSEPVLLDRLEIYAVTVGAGEIRPTDPELVKAVYRIGVIAAGAEGARGAGGAGKAARVSTEPLPPVVFVDHVTPAGALAAKPGKRPTGSELPIIVTTPIRCYLIASFANRTRPGAWTEMFFVPLTPAPVAPTAAETSSDETTLTLKWTPGLASGEGFRVYPVGRNATQAPGTMPEPLNAALLTASTFSEPVVFGTERCFVVRAVSVTGVVAVESDASNTVCLTPKDTFPPPAPIGLVAFSSEGGVSLTWDAVTAADLGGYLVLRGEGTGDRLQPLTATPVSGTQYNDTTTRAGVRYVYAVVAVDTATPANRSKESNRQEIGR